MTDARALPGVDEILARYPVKRSALMPLLHAVQERDGWVSEAGMAEVAESLRIARQCVEKMPEGDYRVQDRKITPPPRARIDESMEALIHHFKIFTEGFKVPAG